MQSTFQLYGDIDKDKTAEIEKYFTLSDNKFIHDIYINSRGGDYNEAIKIGKMVAQHATRGVGSGHVKSSGFLIMQCCVERIATKETEFLLHFPGFKDGTISLAHLRVFRVFLTMLAKKSKQSVPFLWNLAREERILSAEETLELRLSID